MLTLTRRAHQAIAEISRTTAPAQLPGLRIAQRADRPSFSVKRAVVPERTDEVIEHDGARVFLGPIAARHFADSILDVRKDRLDRLEFVVRDRLVK